MNFTGPERALALNQAKVRREIAIEAGGCKFCIHRVEGFGLYACKSETRTFPACLQQTITTFSADHEKLDEAFNAHRKSAG